MINIDYATVRTVEDVLAFYATEMLRRGWSPVEREAVPGSPEGRVFRKVSGGIAVQFEVYIDSQTAMGLEYSVQIIDSTTIPALCDEL